MKIYISKRDININSLENYCKYNNNFKIIYSDNGIFKIHNNNINKLNITDKSIETLSVNGIALFIDKSIISIVSNITTIPYRHKTIDINEIKYKTTTKSLLALVVQYSKNKIIDTYFEYNDNIINNNIINDISEYLKIIY
tara:strand:+ start:1699 stop:2118 length:420 start_codon:yes stop_codon:yes gene_type:complete